MHDLVCKFVIRKGENFGESIDVYNDYLIIKIGSEFIGVALSKIEKVEAEKVYISDFDEKEAEELGKKWVNEKSKPISLEELKILVDEDEKGEREEIEEIDEIVKNIQQQKQE
jgi:hypothetical protein